jgi:hypothetical protein
VRRAGQGLRSGDRPLLEQAGIVNQPQL